MLNIFRRRLKLGNLVEIALTDDAVKFRGAFTCYGRDASGKTNIPGRFVSGHFMAVEDHYISVTGEWNKLTNEAEDGETRVYREVIKSYRR